MACYHNFGELVYTLAGTVGVSVKSDLSDISQGDVAVSYLPDMRSALYFQKSQAIKRTKNSPFQNLKDLLSNFDSAQEEYCQFVIGEIYPDTVKMRMSVLLQLQKYLASDFFRERYLSHIDIRDEDSVVRLLPDGVLENVLRQERPGWPHDSYPKMARNLVVAAVAEVLISNNTRAVPIYEELTEDEAQDHGILAFAGERFVRTRPDVALLDFPDIDPKNLEWSQVTEFRKDKSSELASLREFLSLSRCRSKSELTERLEKMFASHDRAITKHGLVAIKGTAKAILDNSVSSALILGVISVLIAGGGIGEIKGLTNLIAQDANADLSGILEKIGIPMVLSLTALQTGQLVMKIGETITPEVAKIREARGPEIQYLRSIQSKFSDKS